jgi:hypothetical protein
MAVFFNSLWMNPMNRCTYPLWGGSTMSRKVFIKTFGCQMNEYDSDKMADVLRCRRGLRADRQTPKRPI